MSFTREPACAALLALATSAYPWTSTPTRRLKLWTDVAPALRPALFQSESGKDSYDWKNAAAPKRTFTVRWFAYVSASDANPGAPQLTAIRDALDAAMAPTGSDIGLGRNTLGGLCWIARIKDVPVVEPGDLDDDGMLVVEVEIVLP